MRCHAMSTCHGTRAHNPNSKLQLQYKLQLQTFTHHETLPNYQLKLQLRQKMREGEPERRDPQEQHGELRKVPLV